MTPQQETSVPIDSDSQRNNSMEQDAKTATDWLRMRNFTLPPADAQDIVAAVRSLAGTIEAEVEKHDMMAPPEPFQDCLLRLAAEDRGANKGRPDFSDTGWTIENLAAREFSSEEWVTQSLAAIETREPGRLAWYEVAADTALAEARKLDRERAQGKVRGPLHGVPIGLKDMFDHAGRVASWGSVIRASAAPAREDATIVARLKAAGAVVLGFQNMAELAMSPTGLNVGRGSGRNPWNVEHVSGGSSSGGGMSVGAGHVPIAIGSDTGGSVRLPAALCGVTGLKPTQYRVSLAGAMPLSPSLDCIGPLAQSVVDCGWAYSAMAGADKRDPSCLALATPEPVWMRALDRPLRVAVLDLEAGELVSPDMLRAYAEACAALKDAGVECMRVPLPDMAAYGNLGSTLLAAESSALHRRWLKQDTSLYGHQVLRRLTRGLLVPGLDYFDSLRMRPRILAAFLAAHMQDADALVLPATPDGAPRLADTIGGDESQLERDFSRLSMWTRGINYLGLPGLSVPAGFNRGGLPLAVQFIGRPLGEDRLLALGKHFQECTDWHRMSPA